MPFRPCFIFAFLALSEANFNRLYFGELGINASNVKAVFPGGITAPPKCSTLSLECRFPFITSKGHRYDRCVKQKDGESWCSLDRRGQNTYYGVCKKECENNYRQCSTVQSECKFPFKYRGSYRGTCHSAVFGTHRSYSWCATERTASLQFNDKYGFCGDDCPHDCQTTEERCIFPFQYMGKTYHKCTKDYTGFPWCSGATYPNGTHIFGQHVRCRSNMCSSGKNPCDPGLEQCRFPAFYRGKVHYSCLYDPGVDLYPWCPTKLDSHGRYNIFSGHYGWCDSSCSEQKKAVGLLLEENDLLATASSHYRNDFYYSPDRAVDGHISLDSNDFFSSGSKEPFQWLQVSWGPNVTEYIAAVIVYHRMDCCASKFRNIEIRVSERGHTPDPSLRSRLSGDYCTTVRETDDEAEYEMHVSVHHCWKPMRGKYVTLQKLSEGTFSVNEIKLYVTYRVNKEPYQGRPDRYKNYRRFKYPPNVLFHPEKIWFKNAKGSKAPKFGLPRRSKKGGKEGKGSG